VAGLVLDLLLDLVGLVLHLVDLLLDLLHLLLLVLAVAGLVVLLAGLLLLVTRLVVLLAGLLLLITRLVLAVLVTRLFALVAGLAILLVARLAGGGGGLLGGSAIRRLGDGSGRLDNRALLGVALHSGIASGAEGIVDDGVVLDAITIGHSGTARNAACMPSGPGAELLSRGSAAVGTRRGRLGLARAAAPADFSLASARRERASAIRRLGSGSGRRHGAGVRVAVLVRLAVAELVLHLLALEEAAARLLAAIARGAAVAPRSPGANAGLFFLSSRGLGRGSGRLGSGAIRRLGSGSGG